MPYRCYKVTTTAGSVLLLARTMAEAIANGLELTNPKAKLLSCLQLGDW